MPPAREAAVARNEFSLKRDAWGRLVYTGGGEEIVGVVPVRAFPIAAPEEGLSLVSPEGHEVAWVDRIADLPADLRALVEEELASREFVPEIRSIVKVSTFATPSIWTVATERGEATLVLRGEEDIRRLPGGMLLIADTHGVQFLIRDAGRLDGASKRLLDRFL